MISRLAQRGYNLVEIAIILTVALMMSSWLAVNYYNVQENERISETKHQIEVIKEAIVDYAASHRIASFRVLNGASSLTVFWRVPSGRPYLPCPDITGDGIEDRLPLYTPSAQGVTLATGGYGDIRPTECYRYKGMLPWRTLNVPGGKADFWGNHFTYRVDPAFASSLLGFDHETATDDSSDIVSMMPPLTVTVLADGRKIALRSTVFSPGLEMSLTVPPALSLIITLWGNTLTYHDTPSLICREAPCNYQALSLTISVIAGAVATTSLTVRNSGYAYDLQVFNEFVPGNIIDGVPVVIVSHGENGYGAIPAEKPISISVNNTDPTNPVTVISMPIRCNQEPFSDDERQNAYFSEGPCGQIKPSGNPAGQNGFVYRQLPRPAAEDEFDDVVGWMTAGELTEKLIKRGVFPAEKLPPLGLEGY